jgi:protein O-GlcNAc transferase
MSKLAEADRAHLEKNFPEAIELYRAVLAQDPTVFEAWYGLASALGSRLHYAEAIAAYRRALALRPRSAGVHVNLGSALGALGYITDAVRNYRISAASEDPRVRAMSLRNLACLAPGDPALDDAAILDIRRAWAAQEALSL